MVRLLIFSVALGLVAEMSAVAQLPPNFHEGGLAVLQGKVQDGAGAPVFGATVRGWWTLESYDFPPPIPDASPPVKTDSDGVFRLCVRYPTNYQSGFLEIRHAQFGRALVHWKYHVKLHRYDGAADPEELPPLGPSPDLPVTVELVKKSTLLLRSKHIFRYERCTPSHLNF